ncbi:MAG: calcineurin-like phosphoesterase C-terminal domain-containing protein [Bacteroidales bacterium]|nr:calcineurin-like phosphoesterase C-terminal domain-containing protein [Bacteroidales bacterium]
MKVYRLLSIFALSCAIVFSCNPDTKPDDPNKGGEDTDERVDQINGTDIEEGMTAVGLVSDATTGQGIPGIPVTDGYSYVTTDANGVYQMAANRYTRKIYLSVPSNYQIPLDPATHIPMFYSENDFDRAKGVNRNDFKLTPQAVEDKFTMIMIGDPQCQTTAQIQRYKTETVPAMLNFINNGQAAGLYPNVYGMTLGDITFDSTDLWAGMKQTMSDLKFASGKWFPIFQCIGNHDHNSLVKSNDYEATAKYVEYFGPTDYSFNRGQVHVIVMDDILCSSVKSNSSPNKATWEYSGGLTKTQYLWLQDDIAQVDNKESKMVFLCMHIPMRAGANSGGASVNKDKFYAEVLTLLKGFKEAHIMIGHTHYQQNYIHTAYTCKGGQPIYEHVHGAACGGWWSCDSNVTGAPNGFNVYEIEGASIVNWTMVGTKNTADYQMRVYDGDQLYSGTKGYTYMWSRASNKGGSSSIVATGNTNLQNAFVAEVFNDDDRNWKLEMWQDGVKIGDFRRLANGSCCNVCLASYFFNELGKNTDSWTNKTASHYWYFVPSSRKPSEEKNWEVRATQTIPASGRVNSFTCSTLTTDYGQF